MLINGNEVNNLFLGGNRFKNIADDYYFPIGTQYYEYYKDPLTKGFILANKDTGITSLTRFDYIIPNAEKIFYDTPIKIIRSYYPNAKVETSKLIDPNAKYYSIDKFNDLDFIDLFTPEQFEKVKLSNYI